MPLPPRFAGLLLSALLAPLACTAAGQSYPNKTIRIITAEAGGGNDFASRLIAQGISEPLGQQVIVDNRGGAGGVIAIDMAAKALPDGYTLLLHGSSIWLLPYLRDNVPWNVNRDFAPVTLPVRSPMVLVIHPSVPANSVKDLIALAKAKPGTLNDAAGGTGSSTHIAAELFKSMAGVNIVRIAYKGAGPAMNALIGGETQLAFATTASTGPHIKSGKLKALAVTSAQPTPLLPGVPAVASTGLPGYEAMTLYGIFVPAKTPAPVIQRLNQEIVRLLREPAVKERFLNAGVEAVGSTPEQLGAVVKAEMATLGKLIKDVGIRDK